MTRLAAHAYPVDEPADDELPEITQHRSRHGRYLRCSGCGSEVVTSAEGMLHDEGCARHRSWR